MTSPECWLHLSSADMTKLVDDDLCAVDEIAELGLPEHQRVGVAHRVAVFEAQRGVLRQQRVVHPQLGPVAGQPGQRAVLPARLVAHQGAVAVGRTCHGGSPVRPGGSMCPHPAACRKPSPRPAPSPPCPRPSWRPRPSNWRASLGWSTNPSGIEHSASNTRLVLAAATLVSMGAAHQGRGVALRPRYRQIERAATGGAVASRLR